MLAENGFKEIRGKRVGLLTNRSGVNRNLVSTIDTLRQAPEVNLVALFAAEHGLRGDIPAGTEFPDATDSRTGLPVYSLYGPGPTRAPTPRMLREIDVLVYEIQDTGCRSYTFISSMGMAMEACAEADVEFVVLDRPNPLGGEQIEGSLLDPKFRSMVGQWPIPYVYGMTAGELARMINGEGWIRKPCRLSVIPMKGWSRKMVWAETSLPWIPTSPYIPHSNSPMHYVSTGILGQIGGVSIGIGYTLPFECVAAPFLDGDQLANVMNGYGIHGVRFVPITYTPFYGAYHAKSIQGVHIFFTDPSRAPKMAINFYALEAVKRLSGRDLFREATRGNRITAFFDKVTGGDSIRRTLLAGTSAAALTRSWRTDEETFRRQRQKYLLYP